MDLEFGRCTNRESLEGFLRRNPGLHLYELGDLDDGIWPNTMWYTASAGGEIEAVLLIFNGYGEPITLALDERDDSLGELIREVSSELPDDGQVHFTPNARPALREAFLLEPDTPEPDHLKMVLRSEPTSTPHAPGEIEQLSPDDADDLARLYEAAFAGDEGESAFHPSMLDQWPFFGVRRDGGLICAAGVHFVSTQIDVAAVANVATHPASRGQGLATAVTAELCRHLRNEVRLIGLNVRKANVVAIRAYRHIGFEAVAEYSEARFHLK